MSGYALGQPYGYGLTQQSTILPGLGSAAAKPAAGAEYTLVLSDYDRWRLVAVSFTLTTSATDVARFVAIEYPGLQDALDIADVAPASVPKSITAQRFNGSINYGTAYAVTSGAMQFPLSGLWLEAGRKVKIAVANIDATDQLGNIHLTFDRWPGGGDVPAESDAPA